MLYDAIARLVRYGTDCGLLPACEKIYATNLLLDCFKEEDYSEPDTLPEQIDLESTLQELLDEAVRRRLIENNIVSRDLFDTRLMNCLVPRPAEVQRCFREHYAHSPLEATEYFSKLSQDSD